MKVVLDTNVLFAAFAAHGLCEAVLEVCLASHRIVLSEHILTELSRHLTGKLKLPAGQVKDIVSFLSEHAEIVLPADVPADACRDSDDLPVLGTALATGADYLVTGDRELLDLGQFQSIPILSPRTFHDHLS